MARYLLKRLNAGMSGFASSVIVGVSWAPWHIGLYRNGPLYMSLFVLLMISYTLVVYVLVVDIGFNVLAAGIFHLMINITNLFSYSIIDDVGFTMVNGLMWAAIAVVVGVMRRSLFTCKTIAE
jgi:hypothetical protein